jgi:excisionase family DNA binding protein
MVDNKDTVKYYHVCLRMREAFIIDNSDQNRRSREDRRKDTDRRSGFDQRQNGNGELVEIETANHHNSILTTKEACRYLKISRPTYMKCIAAGKIKAKKFGRGWKVLQSELKKFLVNTD